MLNINGLNILLKPLNLQLKKTKNGDVYINDYTLDTSQILRKKDDSYHYLFTREEIVYHLIFNNNSLKLSNGLGEAITIGADSFEYCKKDNDNLSRNEALVTINPTIISFYQQKKINATKEEHYSISVKAQTARDLFLFYKKSETSGLDVILKKDSTVSYEDETCKKTDHIRYYNYDGYSQSLINSSDDENIIDGDMDQYVIEDLASQQHVKELLERINSIIPGIGEALVKTNPNLLPVILGITKKIKKKN